MKKRKTREDGERKEDSPSNLPLLDTAHIARIPLPPHPARQQHECHIDQRLDRIYKRYKSAFLFPVSPPLSLLIPSRLNAIDSEPYYPTHPRNKTKPSKENKQHTDQHARPRAAAGPQAPRIRPQLGGRLGKGGMDVCEHAAARVVRRVEEEEVGLDFECVFLKLVCVLVLAVM
jgi:hypothetical protein